MFRRHDHESFLPPWSQMFSRTRARDLKVDLWNAFVDSDLLEICDADCSAIPRILPMSYLPTITSTCRDLTEFLMKFLSLPRRELEAILIPTPITDYLIKELGILRHRHRRITGSLRFDFAIEGTPRPGNLPKLLEINDIGFDGTGRSSYIQETLFTLVPSLKKRLRSLDTAGSEIANMRRLGKNILRLQCDDYNWEEEVLVRKAQARGVRLRLVSPAEFDVERDPDCSTLEHHDIVLRRGRIVIKGEDWPVHAVQMGFSFELSDYQEGHDLYPMLVRSTTPQYSPFLTALFAPKSTLVTLMDENLRRKFLGAHRARRLTPAIIPSWILRGAEDDLQRRYRHRVIKFTDGMGGEQVYLGKKALAKARRLSPRERKDWVVQERLQLNTIEVDGFLSRRRRAICDLGAYVHYDWDGNRFTNFRVGGFITRATNRSLKVNVSGGGIQVPVMFDRAR